MNRSLLRWGFFLFLLSLLTGFAIPSFKSPRLGLSAHTIAVVSSLIVIAVGIVWDSLELGSTTKRYLKWLWVVVGYGNWFGTLLAAVFGGSQLMPVTGSKVPPTPAEDMIVTAIIIPISMLSLLAVLMVLWGLRENLRGVASN